MLTFSILVLSEINYFNLLQGFFVNGIGLINTNRHIALNDFINKNFKEILRIHIIIVHMLKEVDEKD